MQILYKVVIAGRKKLTGGIGEITNSEKGGVGLN